MDLIQEKSNFRQTTLETTMDRSPVKRKNHLKKHLAFNENDYKFLKLSNKISNSVRISEKKKLVKDPSQVLAPVVLGRINNNFEDPYKNNGFSKAASAYIKTPNGVQKIKIS